MPETQDVISRWLPRKDQTVNPNNLRIISFRAIPFQPHQIHTQLINAEKQICLRPGINCSPTQSLLCGQAQAP